MTEVSAGIVRSVEGLILVCRRGEGRRNAHLWEFPGGKREPGEDAAACLRRELLEELSLPVTDIRESGVGVAQGIRFTFLEAHTDAAPVPTEHEAVRFVPARAMLGLDFCPADTPVARRLALSEPPLTDLFWDFDGTLFDSYPLMSRALSRACASLGLPVAQEEALRLMKVSLDHAVRTLSGRLAVTAEDLYAAYSGSAQETRPDDYPLMPRMAEILPALARDGCRHWLVTHRGRSALEALAAKGLLPLFSGLVTKEDGFPRKPAPDAILHLLRAHGIDPAAACMIGDRPLDVEAGRNAGILGCLYDPDGFFPGCPCDLTAEELFSLHGL